MTRLTVLLALALFAAGCGPMNYPQAVPAHYNVRPTDNGVFIFEYDAGNQGQASGDSLTLFTDALNTWTKEHPELSVIRLERLSTTVSYKTTQGQTQSVTVVNVLVYTSPSGKPPAPPKAPPAPQPEEKKGDGK